uniref:Uncharacterized protein n=1 Tax=Octactis speculum TaxID=3111310 RepID=A0A7S2DC98_9STRA|mmetsp:Transcript_46894/g.63810  ORF Transcript_46894/g.63810 Transcript_46894/m.63810 type:complete len:318 (+) Transcript_46894:404-1357(+)
MNMLSPNSFGTHIMYTTLRAHGQKKLHRFEMRDTHTVTDIEGTQPGWRPRHANARRQNNPIRNELDVKDINDTGFKSQRMNCPLRPEYKIHGMTVGDDMSKTMPRKLPKAAEHEYYSLKSDDITGATCGWKPPVQIYPPMEARRHFRNTNFIGDIPGAQPDTVNHAMRTDRVTNPLEPVYRSLDGEPLEYRSNVKWDFNTANNTANNATTRAAPSTARTTGGSSTSRTTPMMSARTPPYSSRSGGGQDMQISTSRTPPYSSRSGGQDMQSSRTPPRSSRNGGGQGMSNTRLNITIPSRNSKSEAALRSEIASVRALN